MGLLMTIIGLVGVALIFFGIVGLIIMSILFVKDIATKVFKEEIDE